MTDIDRIVAVAVKRERRACARKAARLIRECHSLSREEMARIVAYEITNRIVRAAPPPGEQQWLNRTR